MVGRREQIIEAAIRLFTDRGTRSVSTNHIAESIPISPGNLYYHFDSKEAIIRAIYEQAIAEYDDVWRAAAAVTLDPPTLFSLLDAVFAHQWKYRCLQRELPVLVRQDEMLAARYREMQDRRLMLYRSLCQGWIDDGSMRPLDAREVDDLVMATWLVGESWLGYLEAMGQGADKERAGQGAQLIYTLLRPHLTGEAARLVDSHVQAVR